MSWDLIAQDFRGHPPEDDDPGAEPEPMGTAATIREKIDRHLPGVVWSDDRHGVLAGEAFSIEFEIGDETPIRSLVLSVRGGGDAFEALKSFAVPNRWSLFDCSEGAFLDLDGPSAEAFEAFQRYCDRVLPWESRRPKASPRTEGQAPAQPRGAARAKGTRKSKGA